MESLIQPKLKVKTVHDPMNREDGQPLSNSKSSIWCVFGNL